MTTDRNQRLAALSAQRPPRMSVKRQATIGKILATGLTSTTVFGITAALGWSASSASGDTVDQVVFDQATGVITAYRNGQVVSSQQVTGSTVSPVAVAEPTPTPHFPSAAPSITPAPTSPAPAPSNTALAPAPASAPVTAPTTPSPVTIPITIPIAIPAPQPLPPSQASSSGSH